MQHLIVNLRSQGVNTKDITEPIEWYKDYKNEVITCNAFEILFVYQ